MTPNKAHSSEQDAAFAEALYQLIVTNYGDNGTFATRCRERAADGEYRNVPPIGISMEAGICYHLLPQYTALHALIYG